MVLPEHDTAALVAQIHEMREQFAEKLRAQALHLQRLEESLEQIRDEHRRLEGEFWEQFEALGKPESHSLSAPLEAVLGAARNLLTATSPKQMFTFLTEEMHRMGVRAVAFEVRGEAAWAVSARGFGPQLTEQSLRSLVVPLSVDTPFRRVFELGEDFEGDPEGLKKNPNVLSRLKPDLHDAILLLPVRVGGAVAAVLYADSGGSGVLPGDALKLLAEFAGAQLDRLTACAGTAGAAASKNAGSAVRPDAAPSQAPSAGLPNERSKKSGIVPTPGAGAEPDLLQLNETEQKAHKDARRLARLLVSEIEIYNQAQVAEGRKSKDLYRRLKPEIERGRQTYVQKFGTTAGKRFDYFYDELVRILAGNDPSLLGSDCPGPSV